MIFCLKMALAIDKSEFVKNRNGLLSLISYSNKLIVLHRITIYLLFLFQ